MTQYDVINELTIVILTKNEELNIVDVIDNAKQVTNEILIVDSGSTDKTIELAQARGAKVIYRKWDDDFAAQRNFALEHIQTEWVLYLDADERMSVDLTSSIRKALKNPNKAIYKFIRRNSAFGKTFRYGVLAPDSVLRMFPASSVKWQDKVHERPVGELPVMVLNGFLEHNTYVDFAQYINKMNSYSTIAAQNYKLKNKRVNVIKDIIFRPLFAFLKMYILKQGFMDGWLGFVLCISYANYTLNKYVKLKMLK